MRGHALPDGQALQDWSLTPEGLLIWLLRVAMRGREGCPALAAELEAALGANVGEAVAAAQVLGLALLRGGRLFRQDADPTADCAPHEAAVLAAFSAFRAGRDTLAFKALQPWTGAHVRLAVAALAHLAAAFPIHARQPAAHTGRCEREGVASVL